MRAVIRRTSDVNLAASQLQPSAWSGPDRRTRILELYAWSQRHATETIEWYLSEKRSKARWSRGLRACATIYAALGAATPVVALALGDPRLGNWGFVLLAVAAGFIGFDRFFGFSSAWLRYMAAAMNIRAELNDFQLDWVARMNDIESTEPTPEQAAEFIYLVSRFIRQVDEEVREETESWLNEFRARLSELDSRTRHAREASEPNPPEAIHSSKDTA